MCRALLYLGEPVLLDDLLYQPDSALVRQTTMAKMLHMLNLAGFGMRAWDHGSREPGKPWTYGSTALPIFMLVVLLVVVPLLVARRNARP